MQALLDPLPLQAVRRERFPHPDIQCWSPGHLDRIGEAYADSDLLSCTIGVAVLRLAVDRHRVCPSACWRAAAAVDDRQCHWNLDACLSPGGLPLTAAGFQDRQRAPMSAVCHAGCVRRDGDLFRAVSRTGPFLAGWP